MHFHLPKPVHGWREFIGEVGIIVIGILIALSGEQVVEWVHWRDKQHEMLERLFEESRADVAQLRARHAADFRREEVFAGDLTTSNSCPPPQEWLAVATLGRYPKVRVSTSVYDEIVGSGGLAEIASSRIRNSVSAFHSALEWTQSQTEFFRSAQERPVAMDDPRVTVTYHPGADEPEVMSFDRGALCHDHGFRNRVAENVRNHVVWDGFRQRLTDLAIAMCGELGRSLGRQCTPAKGPPLTRAERKVAEQGAGD